MNNFSFRDPTGFIIIKNNKILRKIYYKKNNFYKILFKKKWYKKLVREKKIQNILYLKSDKKFSTYSHKKFIFPIFANEFCAEQLYQAGMLTIEIALESIKDNVILKDASAWNVVFDDAKPIFIDVTSFEIYKKERVWFAHGQFCRHFIIPLILHKETKLKISSFFNSHRDGLDPTFAKKILGLKTFKTLASFETIFLSSIFNYKFKKKNLTNPNGRFNKEIYIKNILRLKEYLKSVRPKMFNSKWSDYEENRTHYSNNDLKLKNRFVSIASKIVKGIALDLGCNKGEYSLQLAKKKIKVISADFDQDCLNQFQRNLKNHNITICDLNIANPTPSIGWENKEHKSFIERAKNKFDLIMCLGLLHHLIVSERIPIEKILKTFSLLSKKYLLIEFIDKDDRKFIEVANYNLNLYNYFTEDYFEKKIKNFFIIKQKQKLRNSKRIIYLLRKR
jgi:2-polyprenyl-3-methyl-5-hydroxy-6-metoxy-1,4-benzoquinol methylase